MKKSIPLFLFFFFILLACNAHAGSTTMTTYYPPPVGAYNKVTLATNSASPTCDGSNNGTVFADNTGTLHVCINGKSSIYPQECYNSFCSYNPSTDPVCTPVCQGGLLQVVPSITDQFQTSASTTVISTVCCSS